MPKLPEGYCKCDELSAPTISTDSEKGFTYRHFVAAGILLCVLLGVVLVVVALKFTLQQKREAETEAESSATKGATLRCAWKHDYQCSDLPPEVEAQ